MTYMIFSRSRKFVIGKGAMKYLLTKVSITARLGFNVLA